MTAEPIQHEFQEQVAAKIRLAAEGPNRFRGFTPFVFDDGDHLAVVLRKEDAQWVLSDEGHTYMHLARDIDEPDRGKESCQRSVAGALSRFGIEDREGELTCRLPAAAGCRSAPPGARNAEPSHS